MESRKWPQMKRTYLYISVLLLSLQFQNLVSFKHTCLMLAIDISTQPWLLPNPCSGKAKAPGRLLPSTRTSVSKTIANLQENSQTKQESTAAAGNIRRLVLAPEGRVKLNAYPDREFYAFPRFVTHVDDVFISTLTNLYRERLRHGMEILDLMSSWVSHLPKEVEYKRVVGHGLNAQELAKNPQLDYFFVKDLNEDQKLELESCSIDAVVCTVSVQYLQQPEKVFAEVFRVLRPGGVFIISFSNRMFYEKAVSAWRDGSAYSRLQLVIQYFQCVKGFTQPEIIRKIPASSGTGETSPFSWILRLLGLLSGSDPFYAVLAHKNFKPVYTTENN